MVVIVEAKTMSIIIVFLHGSFYKVLFILKSFWKCCYKQEKRSCISAFTVPAGRPNPVPEGCDPTGFSDLPRTVQPGGTGNPAGPEPWRAGFHAPVLTHVVSFALSGVLFKTAVGQHH